MSSGFQVIEKLQDQRRRQILEPKGRDGSVAAIPRESQQQLEGVAVRRGRVRADIPLGGQVAHEIPRHEGGEIGARHSALLSVMR